MKKIIIFLTFFLFILSFTIKNEKYVDVMSYDNINNGYYELDFSNELLNFKNFKLKLSLFNNIRKVYIDYPERIKDYVNDKKYFSFDNSNLERGIVKLKEEYNILLKDKYLFDELDQDINNVIIKKVLIYADDFTIKKFKYKYPNVIVKKI